MTDVARAGTVSLWSLGLDQDGPHSLRLLFDVDPFAYGVRIAVPGFELSDDAFSVPPGGVREPILRRERDLAGGPEGTVTAVNMRGALCVLPADASAHPNDCNRHVLDNRPMFAGSRPQILPVTTTGSPRPGTSWSSGGH